MAHKIELSYFGRDLHAFLSSERAYQDLLGPGYATWTAGGCWILAQAIHKWLGPPTKLWAIVDGDAPRAVQHVVVSIGDFYLDGDGLSSQAALLRRWRDQEGIQRPRLMRFRPEEALGIECPVDRVYKVQDALHEHFGSGKALLRMVT